MDEVMALPMSISDFRLEKLGVAFAEEARKL
jgi:hypothetical protein